MSAGVVGERYETGLSFHQNGHVYNSMYGDGICNCGMAFYSSAHFSTVDAASAAYRAESVARTHARNSRNLASLRDYISVGTWVVVNDQHPNPDRAGLTGIVTHVGRDVVEVEHPAKAGMVHGYLLHQLTVSEVALESVPQFATLEEADAWLEERNPIPDSAIPHFTSVMQAEEWIEEQRRRKNANMPCGMLRQPWLS